MYVLSADSSAKSFGGEPGILYIGCKAKQSSSQNGVIVNSDPKVSLLYIVSVDKGLYFHRNVF